MAKAGENGPWGLEAKPGTKRKGKKCASCGQPTEEMYQMLNQGRSVFDIPYGEKIVTRYGWVSTHTPYNCVEFLMTRIDKLEKSIQMLGSEVYDHSRHFQTY